MFFTFFGAVIMTWQLVYSHRFNWQRNGVPSLVLSCQLLSCLELVSKVTRGQTKSSDVNQVSRGRRSPKNLFPVSKTAKKLNKLKREEKKKLKKKKDEKSEKMWKNGEEKKGNLLPLPSSYQTRNIQIYRISL